MVTTPASRVPDTGIWWNFRLPGTRILHPDSRVEFSVAWHPDSGILILHPDSSGTRILDLGILASKEP